MVAPSYMLPRRAASFFSEAEYFLYARQETLQICGTLRGADGHEHGQTQF